MRSRAEFVSLASHEIIDLIEKHQSKRLPKALKTNIPMLMDYALNVLHGVEYTDSPTAKVKPKAPEPRPETKPKERGDRK